MLLFLEIHEFPSEFQHIALSRKTSVVKMSSNCFSRDGL